MLESQVEHEAHGGLRFINQWEGLDDVIQADDIYQQAPSL